MIRRIAAITSLAALLGAGLASGAAAADEPLRLLGRTEVPNFEGDFDHFAADVKGNRLFLAGEEKGTLEVFDLASGRHLRTVNGFDEPHAIHFMPEANRLIVTDSGKGMTKILDATTYRTVGTIKLVQGADVLSYDPSTRRAWITTGGKNAEPKLKRTTVSVVDVDTGKRVGDIGFDTDFTEGIAAEQKGSRVFINLAGRSEIAVVDKSTLKQVAVWPVKEGRNNSSIALDEESKRLFIVTRKPFKLVVIDIDTGRSVASFEAPQRTNELQLDRANRRIYLAGDDYVGVFQQLDADHYKELARVRSEKGAKTALLVPEVGKLYVAVAGKGGVKAGVLRYEVLPSNPR